MSETTTYRAIGKAFIAEGVDTQFTLMGDGNMHWVTALAGEHGVRTIHARHEHCAVSMAMGYSRATGNVGVASVTMGPGFTQITTALTSAARNRVPVIMFAGDTPTGTRYAHQGFDQAPVTTATGAHHVAVRSVERAQDCVREAFYVAKTEQRPVVLSVPTDLQNKPWLSPEQYVPSAAMIPTTSVVTPDPKTLSDLADKLSRAERPIFIGGRGAVRSGAAGDIDALATHCGALLATTLHARGLFDDSPYSLNIAGGFSSEMTRHFFSQADLVVGFGASLGHHTKDGGKLFPQAETVQVDARPHGLHQGLPVADVHVRADAKLAAQGLLARLSGQARRTGLRTEETEAKIRSFRDPALFDIEPNVLDVREAIAALDIALPKDWAIVGASGHSFFFSATGMRGRAPSDFISLKDFGEIGSHLSYAIGVAVGRDDGKVAVIDGDGSLMMHIQELETIQRHGLRLLIIALNDGAYGAEVHKLRHQNHFPEQAIFGRPDYEAIARGFGLRGATITEAPQFKGLFERHAAGNSAEMWNVHISQNVISPTYRRRHGIATKTAKETSPAR